MKSALCIFSQATCAEEVRRTHSDFLRFQWRLCVFSIWKVCSLLFTLKTQVLPLSPCIHCFAIGVINNPKVSPHQGTLFFYIQLCKTNVIEEFFYFKLGNKQKHAIKQTNKNIAGDPGQKKIRIVHYRNIQNITLANLTSSSQFSI